jgi:ribosomal protein S18 acetylase RimI-like enzyme
MSEVSIRRAEPADARLLAQLAAETFPLACPPSLSAEDIQAFIDLTLSQEAFGRYLCNPHYRIWLATAQSDAVGYAMSVHREPQDPAIRVVLQGSPSVELSKMYVKSGYHGFGIATLLMAEVLADARFEGAQSVWLGVNHHNERANGFYDKEGFALVGERSFQVGRQIEADFVRERFL